MRAGGFTTLMRLPTPWPPARDGILLSNTNEGTHTILVGRTDGSLMLGVSSEDGLARMIEFQCISVAGSGWIILSARWNEHGASIRINSEELLAGGSKQLPVKHILTKTVNDFDSLLYPNLTREDAKNDAEALFLGTIIDLDRTILERDWYTAIRAGNSIRQLLLEGLLEHVNRQYRLKLTVSVNNADEHMSELLKFGGGSLWICCDPIATPSNNIVSLKFQEFLSKKYLYHKGLYASVKDVIKACANSKGGVHFGPAKEGGEEAVVSFDEINQATGLPISLYGLLGICRVSIAGMRSLVEAICNNSTSN